MAANSNKRIWIWGLVVLGVVSVIWYRGRVLGEPQSTGTTRVVFVTGGSDAFWQLTARGAEDAAQDHSALLEIVMPSQDESLAEQIQILSNIKLDKVDGVAVSPLDPEAETRLINRIAENTNIVTFDSDAPLSNRQTYVGTSNFHAGQLCAQLVREAVPEGGKIAILAANLSKHNMSERKLGFEDVMEQESVEDESTSPPSYEVVAYLVDDGSLARCTENVQEVLANHDDLACIVGMNGYHGPVLLETLAAIGSSDDVKLVAFDEADETLDGVGNGRIYATVAQDPYMYGYEAVRMLTVLNNGTAGAMPLLGGHEITVRCEAIRQENLTEFRQRLQDRLDVQQPRESSDTEA